MQTPVSSESGIFNVRALFGFVFCSAATFFTMLAFGAAGSNPLVPAGEAKLVPSKLTQPGSGPGWSLVTPTLAPSEPNYMNSIACNSTSDCWAVGNGFGPLIEHWDGHSWKIAASPNNGSYGNELFGITCVSSSDCWAIGEYFLFGGEGEPLTEHWDGTSWTIVTSPILYNNSDNFLSSVACTSTDDCWAVGVRRDANYTSITLIEHWDGSSWSIVDSPTGEAGTYSYPVLESIACVAPTECWAVGSYADPNDMAKTLVEHWDGSSWSIVPSPNKPSNDIRDDNYLFDVTCTSPSDCWAVGQSFGPFGGPSERTLTEHWDGNAWNIVDSPDAPGEIEFDSLKAVACASASDCWAAGTYQGSSTEEAFMEHWNGIAWSVVPIPNMSPQYDSYSSRMACVSGSECWLIGSYSPDRLTWQTLAEHWDGTQWTIVKSPNNEPQTLSAVACLSNSDCWAVGAYTYYWDGYHHPLYTHWDGISWTPLTSPFEKADYYLNDLTCISSSLCWAVGYYVDQNENNKEHTTIKRGDGNSWEIVPSPNTSVDQNNLLTSLTCNSVFDCWAVGYYDSGSGVNNTLIEHWDGTSWSIVSSPNAPVGSSLLSGVTCTTATDCWAVGYSSDPVVHIAQTLVAHWDGGAWQIVSSPNTLPTQSNSLNTISCSSSSDCWAVGAYLNGNPIQTGVKQTLTEHWDGNSWSIVSSPNAISGQDNELTRVRCASGSCWAVGYANSDTTIRQTLIEQWDGNSWSVTPSKNASSTQNVLSGVACGSQSQCWAVGYYNNADNVSEPLLEVYSASNPPSVGAVSRMSHGLSGSFDVNLPLAGSPGVECRNGAGNYHLIVTFINDVAECGSPTTSGATVVRGPNANQCTESLAGISSAQYVDATLHDIIDVEGNTGSISLSMAVLIGDTNGDGVVNSADIGQTKSKSGQLSSASNFREDLNVDGSINSADIGLVKAKSGTALP